MIWNKYNFYIIFVLEFETIKNKYYECKFKLQNNWC